MTPIQYFDAAKAAMGVTSDYEFAKRMETNQGTISGIREGKRGVPVELAFRLAITLELDPASVVADLESQQAKESKQAFWRSFLSRAALVGALACTLAWSSFVTSEAAAVATGGLVAASAAVFLLRRSAHNLGLR
jgi:transcriptional regulator with XRE-family HTH domain